MRKLLVGLVIGGSLVGAIWLWQTRSGDQDLQERCATQAQRWFKIAGFEKQASASYENHYNARLGKCFVKIETVDIATVSGASLWDAVEGTEYGAFMLLASRIEPAICHVAAPNQAKTFCHSVDEFNEAVKSYMER